MKRLALAGFALALAGCEQTLPPTAEGLKLIAARTANGTKSTKLETKTQPSPPLAGNVSIWDFKVFDIVDKPDKTRKEWKFFNALPQGSSYKSTTEVLMNAWLISKDGSVFLPQKPAYKQYGSFVTDWTVPQAGSYTLWVEYQPVKAKDELSFEDRQKAPILELEHAHWDVEVGGTSQLSHSLTPSEHGGAFRVYSLDSSDYGATAAEIEASFDPGKAKVNQKTTFPFSIDGKSGLEITDPTITALSPDGQTLLHSVSNVLQKVLAKPQLTFPQKGRWKAYFTFSVEDKQYVCPVEIKVD